MAAHDPLIQQIISRQAARSDPREPAASTSGSPTPSWSYPSPQLVPPPFNSYATLPSLSPTSPTWHSSSASSVSAPRSATQPSPSDDRSFPSYPYPSKTAQPIRHHTSYPSLRNLLNRDPEDEVIPPQRERSLPPSDHFPFTSLSPVISTPSSTSTQWPFAFSVPGGSADDMDVDRSRPSTGSSSLRSSDVGPLPYVKSRPSLPNNFEPPAPPYPHRHQHQLPPIQIDRKSVV